jgi:hypothetical protein
METETKEKPHVHILIATPGHSVTASYLKSFLATIAKLSDLGMSFAWLNHFSSLVGHAREVTISGTTENDLFNKSVLMGQVTYDKIVWIDSDISWTVDQFMKLISTEKDIVTGAYLLSNGSVAAYKQILGDPYTQEEIEKATDYIEVEGAGMGFMAINPGVFEEIDRPWFSSAPITVKFEDGSEPYTFPIMGEDISFLRKAINKGRKVYLDPKIKVTHHKTIALDWSK